MATQYQFKITDPAVDDLDGLGMAFPSEEARDATLSYALAQNGITVDDLAQIVFTRVDDGKMTIEKALQCGEDVTSRARFAEEEEVKVVPHRLTAEGFFEAQERSNVARRELGLD